MKSKSLLAVFSLLFSTALISGCASGGKDRGSKADKSTPVYYAVAVLNPTAGNTVSGEVHFSEGFGEVKVMAKLKGLPPNSEHGFHIHEFGDCRAANGSSAGGHYNPATHQHGAPNSEARHAGDLGNIKSNAKGEATLKLEMRNISLSGTASPIVGRGMIVHKNPDDLVSQPTGGAGDRLACGVIGAVEKL